MESYQIIKLNKQEHDLLYHFRRYESCNVHDEFFPEFRAIQELRKETKELVFDYSVSVEAMQCTVEYFIEQSINFLLVKRLSELQKKDV